MADPVVHITNGIPDVGTGNITTLGQTLIDGANFTWGATTDVAVAAGAVGSISAKLRSISRDLVGGIVLQTGANTIGAVTQAGAPWSISGTVGISGSVTVTGTVAATQSGTWNINNISGTITLPTGAATAAKQPALGVAGTPSTDVLTVQGATSMTALKVDGSAVTQPISGNVGITGTVSAVQSGVWNVGVTGTVSVVQGGNFTTRIVGNLGGVLDFASTQNVTAPAQAILTGAEYNTVPTTLTSGNASPLQLDSSANLLVNVKTSALPAGAATSANQTSAAAQGSTTSGQTGPLVQGAVTTASPSYTTGQTSPLSLDTSGNLRVNVVAGGGAGGTSSSYGAAFPATGTAIGVKDNAGTNMTFLQVNASNALKVDGSAVTQPVSGTFWQATQPVSGTFWQATQPVSIAAAVTVSQGTAANLNATVTGTVAATQSGAWNITNITGTVSLPTGAATAANQCSAAALGSTTSGQTGHLALGAVTTAAPTYTTAQSNALSLTTAGALRVDGSAVTQPVSGTFWQATQPVSGTVTVTQGSAASLNATVVGTVTANQGGTWTTRIVGNAAGVLDFAGQNATSPANALLIGGQFNTTPTTVVNGNSSPLQLDSSGNLKVNIQAGAGSGGTASSYGSAFPGQGTAIGVKDSTGTNMTNLKANASNALVVDGSGVTQPTSQPSFQNISSNFTSGSALNAAWTIYNAGNVAESTITGVINQTTTLTAGAFTFEESFDQLGTWKSVPAARLIDPSTGAQLSNPYTVVANANQPFQVVSSGASAIRVRLSTVITGTGTVSFNYTTTPQVSVVSVVGTSATGAVKVDGSAVTQPVSGTVTANQGSPPWSIKPDGTVWTMSGTSAMVVAGQSGTWNVGVTQGGNVAVVKAGSTAAVAGDPSLVVQISPNTPAIAVTQATSSNLKAQVDPLTIGTWGLAAATQNVASPTNAQLMQGQFNTSPTTITSGNVSPLQLDSAGNLLVNIKAGAGSGGTASSFGSAFPSTGTAIGFKDSTGTNMAAGSLDGAGNLKVYFNPTEWLQTGSAWTSATPLNTTIGLVDGTGQVSSSLTGQITQTSTLTAGAVTFEETWDNSTWKTVPAARVLDPSTGTQLSNPYTFVPSTNQAFEIVFSGAVKTRARLSTVITGTGSVTIGWNQAVTASAPTQIVGTGTFPVQVTGSVAVTGTFWQATQPVSGTFWQATQPVSIAATVAVNGAAVTNADAVATNTASVPSAAYGYGFNGTTWDRLQVDGSKNLKINLRNASGTELGNSAASPLTTGLVNVTPGSNTTGAWNSSTTVNSTFLLVATSSSVPSIVGQVTVTSTITAGAFTFEESFDNGTTWKSIPAGRLIDPTTGLQIANPYTLVASTNQQYEVICCGTNQLRVRLSTAITGTGSATTTIVTTPTPHQTLVFQNNAANLQAAVGGDTASGSADAGNPVKIGGRAATTTFPTAVSNGQRVNAMFDKTGRLVAVGSQREMKGVTKTSITTTAETTVIASVAGTFVDVYAIVITNKSATSCFVDFKDATAGTTRMTLAAPAGDTRGFTVPVDSAMVQAAAANNWTATASAAVTSLEITMLYTLNQ